MCVCATRHLMINDDDYNDNLERMLKYRYHRYGCLGNFIQFSFGIIKTLQQKPSIFFYLPPPEWKKIEILNVYYVKKTSQKIKNQ